MTYGVPSKSQSPAGDRAVSRRGLVRGAVKIVRVGSLAAGLLSGLLFASTAAAATASVGLGKAASFSVLGGSTITNTGPTTMFGDLGLSPGSAVVGAPQVLGQTHVDDAVAGEAKNALTSAYNDAASRPSSGSSGTDLSGQVFLPGVRTASSSLLLSSGSVTLDAQGNPDAVFIFQIGSTLTTGSNTTVSLTGGAQACNVFWQVGSSATLGTGTSFVGTIMAATSIVANTAATIHGRLLAQTGAVTLETNTITTSNCASSESGSGGGGEVPTAAESAGTGPSGPTGAGSTPGRPGSTPGSPGSSPARPGTPRPPIGSRTTGKRRSSHKRSHRKASKPPMSARRALPHRRGAFTG